jgi:hypothetical protein
MSTHPDVDLVLHAGGELPDDRRAALLAHLETCAACRAELAFLRAGEERLRSISVAISAEQGDALATGRIRAGAAMPASPALRRRAFFAAAAGLAVGASGGAGLTWRLTSAAPAATASTPGASGPVFMLLIQELVSERLALAPDALRDRSRAMGDWMARLRQEGRFAGGQRLRDEAGRLVSRAGVDDRAGRVDAGELLSGFFLIRASGYDEATAIAATCPIVSFGGRVAVRQVA